MEKFIDLTILSPTATLKDVEKICDIAIEKKYRSVCIPPIFTEIINRKYNKNPQKMDNTHPLVRKRRLKICSVVGFPLGNISLKHKIEEYRTLCMNCDELDIVLPINLIKSGEWEKVSEEIYSLSSHVNFWHAPIKFILETCYLNEDEIQRVCAICYQLSGVIALKTSTGFGKHGATVEAVQMIRKYWKGHIKASGGIKTKEQAEELMKVGATIIGTSSIF